MLSNWIEADNKSDKTEAVNAAQKLVSEKVSWCWEATVPACPLQPDRFSQTPRFRPLAVPANPQVTEGNDYYFRLALHRPLPGTVTANCAYQNGAKSAAVITQLGDDYSSGLDSYFKEAFAKLGGNIVSVEQFQTNQTDFKAILTNIRAADPLTSSLLHPPSPCPLNHQAGQELGITATIAAGDTWENSTIIETPGADSEESCSPPS